MKGKQQGQDRNASSDAEARAWFTRFRNDDAFKTQDDFAQTKAEFERWLAESPEHRQAYERIATAFQQADILKRSKQFGRDRGDQGSFFVSQYKVISGLAVAAAAVSVFVILGLGSAPVPEPKQKQIVASRTVNPLATRQ